MFYTIYKVTNKINGKYYIGKHQTKDLDDGYMGSGKLLKRAIKKYGIDNFKKEILHVFDNENEMNNKEKELVDKDFCLREDTYNLTGGGYGSWVYANLLGTPNPFKDKKFAKKCSFKGNQKKQFLLENDPSWVEQYSLKLSTGIKKHYKENGHHWLGRKHLETTKQKIGIANSKLVGTKNSQYGTMWITNGIENQKIKKIDKIPDGWYKGRKSWVKGV